MISLKFWSKAVVRIFLILNLTFINVVGHEYSDPAPARAAQSNETWLAAEYGYQIAVGASSACVVVSDGSVKCWGSNSSGQLGTGNFNKQLKPVKVVGISNAIAVSVGKVHSCALIRGGTVKCWGHSAFGELGNGVSGDVSKDFSTPVSVKNLAGATQISSGGYLSCALLATKIVKCWGAFDDSGSEEGVMDTPTVIEGISDATKIAAGERQICAIRQDRSAVCSNRWPTAGWQPVRVGTISDAIAIEAMGSNGCLLREIGAVYCWDFDDPSGPHQSVSPSDVASFSMSNCISKTDGTAWCRYLNNYGQLGNNSAPSFFTDDFVRVAGITDAVAIVGAGYRNCALLSSGSVKCWGYNKGGQIGDGTTKNRFTPTQVSGLNQGVFQSSIGSNSIDLNWVGSLAPVGSQVSDYIIEYRKENDSSYTLWPDNVSSSRSLFINGLEDATAYRIRISPVVSGETLEGVLYRFGTRGTAVVNFQVQTSTGDAVRFGKYSWKTLDGSAKSSTSRDANALGFVSFGSVPAKEISITLSGGQLEDGATISGTFIAIASKGDLLLTLPDVPQYISKRVRVKLTSGEGVPNANVFSMNLENSQNLVGSSFEGSVFSPAGITGKTDADGWVTLRGFATDDVYVQGSYDDGQLDQSTDFVAVGDSDTELNLGYLPILRLSAESFDSTMNSIIEIPITVGEFGAQGAKIKAAAVRSVNVSVVAPPGSNQKACGKKTVLSAKTNSSGQATLKLCANLSGEYALVSKGAVSAGAITVRVSNAVPMQVTSLNMASESNGSITVTWGNPLFDGGSSIDSYKVLLKSGTVTKTITIKSNDANFSQKTVVFTGLASARQWAAQVQPHNRFGFGPLTSQNFVLLR
ncbi:MAG: hypothetical protein RL166_239 [Actinomycetota bacterium]|jgi:alpha-tubulin suppressor-like RCC1 family protein